MLAVKVGFGKGRLAKVPWISFLGYGQQNQNGIYPVFLYYKAEQLLVLARGVSDTETPTRLWPGGAGAKTIDQLFVERFSYEAERYGNSFVYRAYRIPADIDYDTIAQELDNLVAEYHELMSQGQSSPAATATVPATLVVASVAREPDPLPYTVKEATEALFITQQRFEEILAIWRQKRNLVVQGPPGVGKTFFYRRLAYALMGSAATTRIVSVQFHPSYSYEDFVQGYRPAEVGFVLREGVFYRFCQQARKDSGHTYVFVIDEINRGNLAKIFGELLMLLEGDKRNAEWAVPLAYGGPGAEAFFIPDNVYLLGLMNTADRSLAVVDYALRRRFAFVDLKPEFASPRFSEQLKEKGISEALLRRIIERMTALNDEIAKDRANLGPGYRIGHSFFCDPPEESALHEDWYQQVVKSEIAPLLDEYYFDDSERALTLVQRLLRGG
jgi:5-methylcytosine-specific restriction protein B